MTTVPASVLVNVIPNVLAAGGTGLDLIGLMLTNNTRVPIGTVAPFPSALAVQNYFGPTSQEASIAGGYFAGFDNSNIKPGSILFAQYASAAVSAFLRGASVASMTLAELQALNLLFNVTIDGVLKTATINLATATSFSVAAELIADALGITGVVHGTGTGSIGGTFTGSTAASVLTVSAVLTGSLQAGDVVTGTNGGNTLNATIVDQLTGAPGGTGTYTISTPATPSNLASTTITSVSTKLNLTGLSTGAFGVADVISGTGITVSTYITSQVSGTTGGVGIYTVSDAQTASSTAITARTPAVQYDSVSGAFVVYSGTTGAASTITFASGGLAEALKLTSATGAVLSQGAAAATPSGFMTALTSVTRNWATFMTLFNPDASGNANKLLFATWNGQQNRRYAYVCWDTDASPTTTVPATASLGQLLDAAAIDGTALIYALDNTQGPLHAAFICGTAASIDFDELNGRTTFAGRSQSGIAASVTDETIYANLLANNYNAVTAIATAAQGFTIYEPGSVTGAFQWMDSYVNEIWLTNSFQLALMQLLVGTKSIPFNVDGYTQIEAQLTEPINAGLAFGAYRAGVSLSAGQVAQVNADAGKIISTTLTNQGWSLVIFDATTAVRAARGPVNGKFWYMDGESVQTIDLSTIAVL